MVLNALPRALRCQEENGPEHERSLPPETSPVTIVRGDLRTVSSERGESLKDVKQNNSVGERTRYTEKGWSGVHFKYISMPVLDRSRNSRRTRAGLRRAASFRIERLLIVDSGYYGFVFGARDALINMWE